MGNTKKYFAELLGTFVLVFMGCGSAVIAGDKIGFLGISLAFGISVVAMAYAIGPISGCHINPAVTAGMVAAGRMKSKEAAPYIIAQCIGAVAAAACLLFIASGRTGYSVATKGLGQNGYGACSPCGYDAMAGFIAEGILTAIFIFTILGATAKNAASEFGGLAIGLCLVMVHLVGIPITGTSVNPARSLGPAVMVGGQALSQLWLFWAAPLLGAILAGFAWRSLFEKDAAA